MSGLILTEQLTSAVALAEGRHTTEPYSFSDIPRLTIPRDIARGWTWQSLLGDVKAGDELEGVYLGHTNPEYALWPYTGGGSNSAPPYLRSVDGVIGYRTGTDAGDLDKEKIESAANEDGTYRWKEIEYCQWQERNGRRIPPRAKQTVRVYLLYSNGEVLSVSLPGTSIKFFSKFAASAFAVPGAITIKLKLEETTGSSNTYVVAKTIVGQALDPEAAERVRRVYADRVAPLLEPRTPSREAKETVDVVPF